MDYIREFDIRLEKESFYAGETLSGVVILDTVENFKLKAVRVLLRGKAHTEWKVMVSGDRRTVKDDQYFIDDRIVIWGKEKAEGTVPILPRGLHQFPFRFQLPESSLPCSFESRAGTIRYYLKVTVDIPYASPPQGMKYFTIIGPHIDCMDYLRPIRGESKRKRCCLCCESGRVSLRTDFERSAYVCGESLRVKADIDNQSDEEARLKLRLVQYVEYYIDRGVLGVQKEVSHTVLEYRGAPVVPHTRTKWDSQQNLVVPTMPATLVGVCRLIQIYYLLKVNIELEKAGEDLQMHFPVTIATVPFRIPNSNQQPVIAYDVASDHVEGGMYIGPEFLLGQVYDGTTECGESIVLYRPVYPTVKPGNKGMQSSGMNNSSQPQSSASTPTATKGLKVDFSKDSQHPLILQAVQAQQAKSSANSSVKGSQPQACSSKSNKDNENANAGESDIMTTASHEASGADDVSVRPHNSNSSDGSLKKVSSDAKKALVSTSEDSSSGGKKKIRTSSTSSTGGGGEGTEQQKHGKNAVTFSSDGIKDSRDTSRHSIITATTTSGGGVGTGSESKIEKADKNVTKKVVTNQALPGRAVKLEESNAGSSGSRKSLNREETSGENSSVAAESGNKASMAQMIKDGEQKTKI